ncbi:IclR family transcriptional regulator [Savagea sp. SN6]|uniref:IclR family transcriptional regulator n=1 Tax=Savagea serpentis TaxID=2785297 RepID=A0A8J7GL36_9BACL|nr:IclR family transcriptional regulator [Savagea serpentis]MBF4500888.1 IclR family transcriptional regulator [Savagea serpentis]
MSQKNKTVVRSMDILELFYDHPALTFQEMIDISQIPKSSVYRMIRSLEDIGFLEKGDDAKYRLGTLFLKFGHLVSSRIDLRQIAYPHMDALHERFHEAVNLTVREKDEAVYIEKIDQYQRVKLYTAIGRRSPLYAGACPRAILSFLNEQELRDYLERTALHPMALKTMTDETTIRYAVLQARRDGYTVSYSELEDHTAAVGAPIFDYRGEVIGALSMAGLEANYTEEIVRTYGVAVKEAALQISEKMGYDPSHIHYI